MADEGGREVQEDRHQGAQRYTSNPHSATIHIHQANVRPKEP